MNDNDTDTLDDIAANVQYTGGQEDIVVEEKPAEKVKSSSSTAEGGPSISNIDSEIDVFDRIANKLIRSGLLLTALELHAELIERGIFLPRLREFFDNPQNFEGTVEKQLEELSAPARSKNIVRSPSEQTFDSFDFTHYSDDDMERPGDERVAVLEFELRKAQQTINSLRASLTTTSLTMSTAPVGQLESKLVNAKPLNPLEGPVPGVAHLSTFVASLPDSSSFSDRCSLQDYFCRGSADGDSCPGEDELKLPRGNLNLSIDNVFEAHEIKPNSKQSIKQSIKPHERRAINYLINEYLMAINYKLTSITFCDENADQDFEKWDDVGLNTDRPPDLLRLYRYFWQNCSSLLRTSSNATTIGNSTSTPK